MTPFDSPDFRLRLAILKRAALDLAGSDEKEKRAARRWLFDQTDVGDDYVTLTDCAHTLGLRQRLVRIQLARDPASVAERLCRLDEAFTKGAA